MLELNLKNTEEEIFIYVIESNITITIVHKTSNLCSTCYSNKKHKKIVLSNFVQK